MITRQLLETYLTIRLGEPKFSFQGLRYNCPKCDAGAKYNLEINIDRNIFNCWSCHYSGIIRKLFEDYATDLSWKSLSEFKFVGKNLGDVVQEKHINFPKETIPFYLNREINDYLINERGMKKNDLVLRGVSYVYSQNETYHNHICFPFYENNNLIGACLQNFETKKYRNLGKLDYVPYKNFINDLYPIIITEGIYDALSAVNAIPLLGTEINTSIIKYLNGKDVIIAFDNTIDLDHFMDQLKKFDKLNLKSLIIFDLGEYKDMNEFYKKDNEKFLSELKNCYKKTMS